MNIPEIKLNITSQKIKAKRRQLKVKWGIEALMPTPLWAIEVLREAGIYVLGEGEV